MSSGEVEIVKTMTDKVKRRGRVSNNRDKRLNEVLHHQPGDKWSDAKKKEVAMHFIVLGSAKKVEQFTGVGATTISSWRRTSWWEEMVKEIRDQHNDEMDAKMTGIMNSALEHLMGNLENGDIKYDTKTGQYYNVPLSARDAGLVLSIVHDKRAMLRATPNSVSNDMSVDQRLDKLAAKFLEYTKAKEIEGEVIIEEEESNA